MAFGQRTYHNQVIIFQKKRHRRSRAEIHIRLVHQNHDLRISVQNSADVPQIHGFSRGGVGVCDHYAPVGAAERLDRQVKIVPQRDLPVGKPEIIGVYRVE
ncbi:hypothetical protein SDC9_211828 [bioreactor metagenome]|uniref:Uncharacterized protein n=1 Tax=bioreactor metagenome TaxID=1076179 RepID=A0A645JL29_9ZZZZ